MAEAISRTILQPHTEPTMQRGNDTADEADFAESTLARPNRNDRSQNTSEPTHIHIRAQTNGPHAHNSVWRTCTGTR
jgi:hypothetical protein